MKVGNIFSKRIKNISEIDLRGSIIEEAASIFNLLIIYKDSKDRLVSCGATKRQVMDIYDGDEFYFVYPRYKRYYIHRIGNRIGFDNHYERIKSNGIILNRVPSYTFNFKNDKGNSRKGFVIDLNEIERISNWNQLKLY
jgi:hypothetical protein